MSQAPHSPYPWMSGPPAEEPEEDWCGHCERPIDDTCPACGEPRIDIRILREYVDR
jgi:hypothetical protein